MPAPSRRPSTRPSRAQRRATGQSSRNYPLPAVTTDPAAPRRYYSAEPTPVDYGREFRFVRHDLRRILLIAGFLILAIIVLGFVVPNIGL